MRTAAAVIAVIAAIFFGTADANAQDNSYLTGGEFREYENEYYAGSEAGEPDSDLLMRLYEDSGADRLDAAIPDEANDFLGEIGFSGFLPDGCAEITLGGAAGAAAEVFRKAAEEPLRVLSLLIAIVILSAALETVRGNGAADAALSAVVSLCVISVIAPPVLKLTDSLCDTIGASADFMVMYIPVISGLLAASGRPEGAASYSAVMIFAATGVLQITSRVVVPMLRCVMSLSLVSAACEKIRLDGVTELFRRAARYLLTFCMSLFVAFLTMRQIVAAAADSLSNRAVKFAIGSFVPLVGGALSDAYQTVVTCVSMLKTGVGAAAIVAVFAIFLPSAARCMLWQAVSAVGAAVCEMFGAGRVASLLRSLSAVVSVVLAVLMCTMVIYIIGTTVVLIVGS